MGPTDKVLDPPSEELGLNLNSETSLCCHLEHVLSLQAPVSSSANKNVSSSPHILTEPLQRSEGEMEAE